MSSQARGDDFCLECHWEAFHIDGRNSLDSSDTNNTQSAAQLNCAPDVNHDAFTHCDVDEACCDVDDCSLNCPSVCDGFVDCDEKVACSVPHCEDDDCGDTGPVCFDDHCYGHDAGTANNPDLGSLLGLETPLSLDNTDLLSHTETDPTQVGQPGKSIVGGGGGGGGGGGRDHVGTHSPICLLPPYAATTPANTQCIHHHHNPYHYGCHDLFSSYSTQNGVNPADVFHMLGMCPDFSNCHTPHVQGVSYDHSHCGHDHPEGFNTETCSLPPACFHHGGGEGHHHVHNFVKPPVSAAASKNHHNHPFLKGPCRTHHRCRNHAHAHTHHHPYSSISRQSRSSGSSHLLSSPATTPPPLEGGRPSSLLTNPGLSSDAHESLVCKWTTIVHGLKATCGAVFHDEGALQEHLVSKHMVTVDGAKGNGYYCCWEGCHRPDEPFSQKSKLQGHFLTHSNHKNFKCFVCGKMFARQATLERHTRSHRGEKPYSCKVCGKSFTDSSELKTHTRTHTGEKPFKCKYPGCDFETGDSSNMSSHRLTHGERRHRCEFPGCDKSFTRPDQLKRHQRTTHKSNDTSSTSTATSALNTPFPSPIPDQFPLSPFSNMA